MANFFDQFDASQPDRAPVQITVTPQMADQAIASIESGGNYRAVGPPTRDGDRAFGKHQVMGKNIPQWTQEALGQPLNITQFMQSPEAQDAVFKHKFGTYAEKYGPEGAARAWFGGEGAVNNPNRRDVIGTSVDKYGKMFAGSVRKQATGKNFFDQFDGQQEPQAQTAQAQASPVDARFGEMQPPPNPGAMQEGLQQRGAELTRGPEIPPMAQMALEHSNVLSAASQGTNPNVGEYNGKLISNQTFEDDAGNVLYKDPQTGEVRPTDKSTQIALRDPHDNTVKVYSRNDATNEEPVTGASRVLSHGLLAGAPTTRAAIGATKNIVPAASEIFSTAKQPYRQFDAIAARTPPLLPDEAKVMADRIQNALDTAHLPSEVAKQVHDTVALIGKKADGQNALSQLQYVKRAVGNLFKSPDANIRAGAGVASKEITRMIAEASPEAGQALKTADEIHSTARSVQDLQRKKDIANLRTGRAGYGGNAVNNMRTQVEKIVENAVNGKQTGYKPNEIQAMREISDGNWLTNTARQVGAMAPSKGVMQIGLGGATLGTTAALGSAANKLATILTGKQLDQLTALVAKRSPAYKAAVAKAVTKFEKAQIELGNKPGPNTMAAYVSASRALANGLTRDGVKITSGDLIRSIAGPPKAAADAEQNQAPPVPGQ